MLHLVTSEGNTAKRHYLKPDKIADFKSALRSITSSRIFVVSTKFRTDICYSSINDKNEELIKLWNWYTSNDKQNFDANELLTIEGTEEVLSYYFNSIDRLFTNWVYSRRYRKAFQRSYVTDQNNPLLNTIIKCDEYLLKNTLTKRAPLYNSLQVIEPLIDQDTLDIAVKLFQNSTRFN